VSSDERALILSSSDSEAKALTAAFSFKSNSLFSTTEKCHACLFIALGAYAPAFTISVKRLSCTVFAVSNARVLRLSNIVLITEFIYTPF
jgi:hypothetical protein